jgi:hypothetical protein
MTVRGAKVRMTLIAGENNSIEPVLSRKRNVLMLAQCYPNEYSIKMS